MGNKSFRLRCNEITWNEETIHFLLWLLGFWVTMRRTLTSFLLHFFTIIIAVVSGKPMIQQSWKDTKKGFFVFKKDAMYLSWKRLPLDYFLNLSQLAGICRFCGLNCALNLKMSGSVKEQDTEARMTQMDLSPQLFCRLLFVSKLYEYPFLKKKIVTRTLHAAEHLLGSV